MAKLGYTWYPKDWGNSDAVFELTLLERGLYRELIDMAMLCDNKTLVSIKTWARKFGSSDAEIESILITLENLKLIEIKGNLLFIPSCESRLNLVRGGSKGGSFKPNDKPTSKPTVKPSLSLPQSLPSSKEKRKEIEIENNIIKITPLESEQIVFEINKAFGKNCKAMTQYERSLFSDRLNQGYTITDFLNTIQNLKDDEFAKQKNYTFCTTEYISKLETLQKYSQITKQKVYVSNEDKYAQNVLAEVERLESLKKQNK